MAVIQTITITDDSGTAHADMDALMTAFHDACTDDEAIVTKIEEATADGTAITTSTLSESGDVLSISRTWSDASWDEIKDMDSATIGEGWTVVSSNDA
tara:strand:+ start:51 stop:344 length:294 start_codon:yes stop_codon:yes gene_type:complete